MVLLDNLREDDPLTEATKPNFSEIVGEAVELELNDLSQTALLRVYLIDSCL